MRMRRLFFYACNFCALNTRGASFNRCLAERLAERVILRFVTSTRIVLFRNESGNFLGGLSDAMVQEGAI